MFAFALAIYVATMSRGITWLNTGSDGGDFITAARAFGVPHPTGYPTYTLLLRVFGDLVVVGDHAFRANLFSALLGALTVPFVYVAAVRLLHVLPVGEVGKGRSVYVSAVIAAVSFATSRLYWSQTTITEVYTLNALFGAVLLVLALGVVGDLKAGRLAIGNRVLMALLLGLGLGNHTTLGLAAAPFGLWVLWLVWGRQGWRGVFDWRPIVGFVLGISIYVYVPIASSQDPIVSWGVLDTFEGFRWMVSATIYRPYAFGLSGELLPGRISNIAELLFTQFTVVGTVIGVAGLTTIWAYSREFVVVSVVSVLSIAVYAVAYDTVDSFIYLISAFMVFSLWLAVGIAILGQGIGRFAGRTRRLAAYRSQVFVGVFVLVILVIPGWSLASGWGDVDLSNKSEPTEFAEMAVLRAAGGVILAEEPQLFVLEYQAQVGSPELDAMVVGPNMLQFDWYWDQLVKYYGNRMPSERPEAFADRVAWLVALNIGVVPVFSTHDDRVYHEEFDLVEVADDLFEVGY